MARGELNTSESMLVQYTRFNTMVLRHTGDTLVCPCAGAQNQKSNDIIVSHPTNVGEIFVLKPAHDANDALDEPLFKSAFFCLLHRNVYSAPMITMSMLSRSFTQSLFGNTTSVLAPPSRVIAFPLVTPRGLTTERVSTC